MIELNNVTLIAICGNRHGETIAALYKCLQQIKPVKTLLLTNIDISASGIDVINVGGLNSWEAYNEFCVKELNKHFDTSHCLLIQWDGYVLSGDCWSDEFLNYDYVAAKWLDIGKPYNVGNGGFSLRSKKLQDILAVDKNIITTCPEDVSICKVYGQYLMDSYGVKFSDEKTADNFSFELNEPLHKTFGFHGFHWPKFRETVVIKRSHALGDILSIEPLMEYFHKKGYQVALDTGDYFMDFFRQHYFPVVPKSHLNPKLPYKEIDLNKSYEIYPNQLHLDSYYDFAQVPKEDRIIRNPVLSLQFDPRSKFNKLFKKYAVVHIDERDEPHRNIYGVKWIEVVLHLKSNGYFVVQVGVGKHEIIEGAVEMKTPTAPFLMWVVGGADLFLGIDSGIAHIASGFNVPSIILSGSVDLKLLYTSLENKIWIHNHDGVGVCNNKFCWHSAGVTETGQDCYVDKKRPPCTQFKTEQVLQAITKIKNNGQNSFAENGY